MPPLPSSYGGRNAPTDDVAFCLFLRKGAEMKHIRVYRPKLAPIYAFSTKLNREVPPEFQLGYTESFSNY